jgi:hypothetical protein
VTGDYVTLSAFVARGDVDDHGAGHRFGFYDNTAGADVGYITFNYGTGTTSVQSGTVLAHDAVELSDGWLIYMTISHTTGNTLTSYFGAVGADAGTGYFYLAGPKVDPKPYLSSYMPTYGTQVARAAEQLVIPHENISWPASDELSIHIQGRMTYTDTGGLSSILFRQYKNSSENIGAYLYTTGAETGEVNFFQVSGGVSANVPSATDAYGQGVNVPFNIASRHGSTFINGAVDGTALTENTTPTTFPDLETTNLQLAYSGGPIILEEFSLWDVNITDAGTEDATDD